MLKPKYTIDYRVNSEGIHFNFKGGVFANPLLDLIIHKTSSAYYFSSKRNPINLIPIFKENLIEQGKMEAFDE